jgi:hypothetical protein
MGRTPERKDEFLVNSAEHLFSNDAKEDSEAWQEWNRAYDEMERVETGKKARWLSGKGLEDLLHQHGFSIADFVIAIIDGSISPYDKAGLKIITLPSTNLPPGCKYEYLENKDEHQLIYSAGYRYKKEDVEKLLGVREQSAKAQQQEGSEAAVDSLPPKQDARRKEGSAPEKSRAVNFFTKKVGVWQIGFGGKEETIPHIDGLQYICYLLENSGKAISCTKLYQAGSGKRPDSAMTEGVAIDEGLNIDSSVQPVSTPGTIAAYLKKYMELENELLRINDLPDYERTPEDGILKKEIESQIDNIRPYLKKRNFSDPNDRKAQANLTRRLHIAYAAIKKAGMGDMEKHLRAHIKPDKAYGLSYSGTLPWVITL